jgi:enoyl-CoA hydratase/carnithine racemase
MRPFETLIYEKVGTVAHVSLDRPAVLNAYNIQMRDDFAEALSAVGDDPEVLALLITGEGRGFCAGADLTEFGSAPSQVIALRVRWERDVWGQIINLDKPIVVAVHGYCIGSGLEIALLCDLRLAADDTVFAMPEVGLGMIPAAGGTQTLPRNAGTSQALDLLLTGRRFPAQEALEMGLVTRLSPPERLRDDAWRAANGLAQAEHGMVAGLKRALREGSNMTLEQGLELETRVAIAHTGIQTGKIH